MAWNWDQDDDDMDETDYVGGAFHSLFHREVRSMLSPYWGAADPPPERDPDEDPFARIQARAEDDLKKRVESRRRAERREQAQAEAAFAEWLADVRELPEVVS